MSTLGLGARWPRSSRLSSGHCHVASGLGNPALGREVVLVAGGDAQAGPDEVAGGKLARGFTPAVPAVRHGLRLTRCGSEPAILNRPYGMSAQSGSGGGGGMQTFG